MNFAACTHTNFFFFLNFLLKHHKAHSLYTVKALQFENKKLKNYNYASPIQTTAVVVVVVVAFAVVLIYGTAFFIISFVINVVVVAFLFSVVF